MTTISPSMDILVSSNLERLLFELSDGDDKQIADYMKALSNEGRYTASDSIMKRIHQDFDCGWCSDAETETTIKEIFKTQNYLIDTHTAVAYNVLQKYRSKTGDTTKTVVVSTASPFKFCDSVLNALDVKTDLTGIDMIDKLEDVSGVRAPSPLKLLKGRTVRFNECVGRDEMPAVVENFLS